MDTNSFAEAFSRITDANGQYYLLGYAPPAHPRDGRFHRIEVRAKRPGLQVTARRGYPSPSGKTVAERKQEALDRWARGRRNGGAEDTSPALRAALNSAMQQSGYAVVHAARSKTHAKRRRFLASSSTALSRFAPHRTLFADTLEGLLRRKSPARSAARARRNLAIRPNIRA